MPDWQCSQGGECCRATATVEVMPSELAAIRAARPDVTLAVCEGDSRRGTLQIVAGPCPLLGGDGRCTVYDVRPWRCRAWSCFRKPGQPYAHDVMGRRLEESAGVRRVWKRQILTAQPWAQEHGWSRFLPMVQT